MERLSAILKRLEANRSYHIVYIQGKDLTVSFFFCFYDQGEKVYRIGVASLTKPLSQSQSITIARPITTTIIMTFQVNLIGRSRAAHVVVKRLLTFMPATFILFFHTVVYLPLEIIDSVTNNATD